MSHTYTELYTYNELQKLYTVPLIIKGLAVSERRLHALHLSSELLDYDRLMLTNDGSIRELTL